MRSLTRNIVLQSKVQSLDGEGLRVDGGWSWFTFVNADIKLRGLARRRHIITKEQNMEKVYVSPFIMIGVECRCTAYCIAASSSASAPTSLRHIPLALKVAGEKRRRLRDGGCTIRQRLTSTSGALPFTLLAQGRSCVRESLPHCSQVTQCLGQSRTVHRTLPDPCIANYSLRKTNTHPNESNL